MKGLLFFDVGKIEGEISLGRSIILLGFKVEMLINYLSGDVKEVGFERVFLCCSRGYS